MSHRTWLGLWLLAVVGVTFVHAPAALAGLLVMVLALSGNGRLALLRRALFAVLPIMLLLSTGYLVMGWLSGMLAWHYLLLLNLRVLLLALFTAWLVRDIDLERALQGFPALQRGLSVVRSHITVFRRLAAEYRAAVQSRSTIPPTLAQRYRAGAALGLAALDKAVHHSEALTQGMRARGAFDD